ncbi:hypothetical protein [Fusobacterium mortiferum]|jgi:hypothetical protein|uniref:hypothetical protein n=1 Tax=Fusobacterium mortiferum TaxID=850 RepID=UPI003F909808
MQPNPTDQIYDSSLLLGALLRITGMTITEIQWILQGSLILDTLPSTVRATILEKSEYRTSFCRKVLSKNIDVKDLNKIFGTNYDLQMLSSNSDSPNFPLNLYNFSLKDNQKYRKELCLLLKTKYNFSNNEIARFLEIAPSTVSKIFDETKLDETK